MEEINLTMKQAGLSMETDREQFAMALKTWRIRTGLTQQELGERWGISRYTIIRVEKAANVTWRTTYRLFNLLAGELRKEAQQ